MPIESKAYFCEFCRRLYASKELCEYHEKMCTSNPAMRTCHTCSGMYVITCKNNRNITNSDCNGIVAVMGCAAWGLKGD